MRLQRGAKQVGAVTGARHPRADDVRADAATDSPGEVLAEERAAGAVARPLGRRSRARTRRAEQPGRVCAGSVHQRRVDLERAQVVRCADVVDGLDQRALFRARRGGLRGGNKRRVQRKTCTNRYEYGSAKPSGQDAEGIGRCQPCSGEVRNPHNGYCFSAQSVRAESRRGRSRRRSAAVLRTTRRARGRRRRWRRPARASR